MATPIQDIYNGMIATKNGQSELNGLTNTSQTAIYSLFFWIFAVAINLHEQYFDLFKTDLETIKDATPQYNAQWWVYTFLNFYQYNTDPSKGQLKMTNGSVPYYTSIDPASQIVKYAACTISKNYQALIKIAKSNGSNGAVALSDIEVAAANSFVNSMQCAGAKIVVQSSPPDSILLGIIYYSDGSLNQIDVIAQMTLTIQNYLLALPFNGVVYLSSIETLLLNTLMPDGITKAILDLNFKTVQAKKSGEGYTDFIRSYQTDAGYAVFDSASSFTLGDYNQNG